MNEFLPDSESPIEQYLDELYDRLHGPAHVSDGAFRCFVAVLALIALMRSWRPRHDGVSASG